MFLYKIMLTAVKREIFSVLNLCFEAIVTSELNLVTLFTVATGGMNNSCPCTIKLLILSIFFSGECAVLNKQPSLGTPAWYSLFS